MENNTFVFKGKTYEIVPQKHDHQLPSWYAEQMQWAIDNREYNTVKHRIISGLHWKWLKEIK